jgi:hypothetical protein
MKESAAMTARIRLLLAPLALGALLAGASGCIWFLAGAAAGAGTVAWVEGKLVKKYDAPAGKVGLAASAAVKDLHFAVESDVHDAAATRIKAERADGKSVTVDVDRVSDNQCEVAVRVGLLGNDDSALQIMNAIDARLGAK